MSLHRPSWTVTRTRSRPRSAFADAVPLDRSVSLHPIEPSACGDPRMRRPGMHLPVSLIGESVGCGTGAVDPMDKLTLPPRSFLLSLVANSPRTIIGMEKVDFDPDSSSCMQYEAVVLETGILADAVAHTVWVAVHPRERIYSRPRCTRVTVRGRHGGSVRPTLVHAAPVAGI